jgi:hypothetical protein
MRLRGLAWLMAVPLLAGCVNVLAQRQAELSQWIGKPETMLVGAMGAPTRTYDTDGMKFLTYEDQRVEYVPGAPGFYGAGPFWYGGGGFPPEVVTSTCMTTFTIAKGIVQAFSLRGNACG